jgi:hypothetical protein
MLILYDTEQGIYRSLVNADHDVFCMHFDLTNPKYPISLIESSFQREVRYLKKLSKYSWAPELIEINFDTRQIFFKWYGNDCRKKLTENYKDQLLKILIDLHQEKIYKPSFYPKYCYVDDNNNIRCFNFYTASDYSEQPIDIDFYKPILNDDRLELIKKISQNGKLDMGTLMKYAFTEYIDWPDNPLPEIYKKVYDR